MMCIAVAVDRADIQFQLAVRVTSAAGRIVVQHYISLQHYDATLHH